MKIDLTTLEQTGREFAAGYLPDDETFADRSLQAETPLAVAGTIRLNSTDEIVVDGRLSGAVTLACDRCLQPAALDVASDFAERYIGSAEYDRRTADELAEDDLTVAVLDGVLFETDELAREQLLLALPLHILCREDCAGLCAQCGANLNRETCACAEDEIDPRWQGLAALRE